MSYSSDNPQVTNQLTTTVDFAGKAGQVSLDILTRTYRNVADTVNSKTGGLFIPTELSNSEQYFTVNNPQKNRNVYRKLIDFGPLPNAGTKTVSHGIDFTSDFTATRIYATSTDSDSNLYIPIPYASATNDNIELLIDSSNVVIITNSNRSNFIITYVVIEYCKTQ